MREILEQLIADFQDRELPRLTPRRTRLAEIRENHRRRLAHRSSRPGLEVDAEVR